MKWTETFCVNSHDTDAAGNARASAVLRYMQEAANLQFEHYGPSLETLRREEGRAFMISRLALHMAAPLHQYERVTAETWACPSKFTTFLRCGRVSRGGETVAELRSAWALVRLEDHRLCPVGSLTLNFGTEPPIDPCPRFHIPPQTEMEQVGCRTVVYSDVDRNGHMNNTNYPDMFCDFLPLRGGCALPTLRRVTDVSCVFLREAPLGETLRIERLHAAEEADHETYWFRALRSDGTVCTEASVTLTEEAV